MASSTPAQQDSGAPFVTKTYQILSDPANSKFITWSEEGDSFIVWNPVDFSSQVLPRYFKHSNFCSFIRQLNTYGFLKVESKNWEFKHELFRKSQPQQLKQIIRRKSKKREAEPSDEFQKNVGGLSHETTPQAFSFQQPQPSPSQPLDLNGNSDLEKLKGLNHLLTKEVIRLQQQQEATNSTLIHVMSDLMEAKKDIQKLNERLNHLSLGPCPIVASPAQTRPIALEANASISQTGPSTTDQPSDLFLADENLQTELEKILKLQIPQDQPWEDEY